MLGAGLIGQQFIRMLDQHPFLSLRAVIASESSKGEHIAQRWNLPSFSIPETFKGMTLTNLDDIDIESIDIAFSALPAEEAEHIESDLAKNGIKVFSNSSAHRYDEKVPILIPEINGDHLEIVKSQSMYESAGGFIVTNSNCSVSGLAILLNELQIMEPITNVFVSTYQALSGAGLEGIQSIPRDRVIPFIEKEEEKISLEARKILGTFTGDNILPNISINKILANCARVPIIDGHLESVTIEFEDNIDLNKVEHYLGVRENSLKSLPTAPIKHLYLHSENDRPQSVFDLYLGKENKVRSQGMTVSIGRLRVDSNYLRCFLLVHNTIRGGAGGSILNAELAYSKGLL